MKVNVTVLDSKTGVTQTGTIDEPVIKGQEIANAIGHFGVKYSEVNWLNEFEIGKIFTKQGEVEGTTKIVLVACYD